MSIIYSYKKYKDSKITRTLIFPSDPNSPHGGFLGIEIATIDDITYVSIPDGIELPKQPIEIQDSIKIVNLTSELKTYIKTASPHIQIINDNMIKEIRSRYSIDDELYFSRIGMAHAIGMYTLSEEEIQELFEFHNCIESIRISGRENRRIIGF